jgi:hypothetical protein
VPSQCASITGRFVTDDTFLIYGLLFYLVTVVLIVVVLLCSRAFICLVPLVDGFLSLPFLKFIYTILLLLLQLVSTFEHISPILAMNFFIYFIPITLHMPKVVDAISRRVLVLQISPFSLPFALLFCTTSCFAPITSHGTGIEGHVKWVGLEMAK